MSRSKIGKHALQEETSSRRWWLLHNLGYILGKNGRVSRIKAFTFSLCIAKSFCKSRVPGRQNAGHLGMGHS